MYYVADGAAWRIARKAPGVHKAKPEKLADLGVKMDPAFIYFVDRDGDVARAARAPDPHGDGDSGDGDDEG
jgi:hypothetical protein